MKPVLVLLLVLVARRGDEALEGEWTVRRWAMRPAQNAAEIDAALVDDEWQTRARALDACARARPDGVQPFVGAIRAALGDEHPSVRAAALRALLESGDRAPIAADVVERLANDVLPETRIALARAAARGLVAELDGAGATVLARLGADEDPAVREAAWTAHLSAGGELNLVDLLGETDGVDGLQRTDAAERHWRALHVARSGTDVVLGDALLAVLGAASELDLEAALDTLLEDGRIGTPRRWGRYLDGAAGAALLDRWAGLARAGRDDGRLLTIALDALGPRAVIERLASEALPVEAAVHALEEAGGQFAWDVELGRPWLERRSSEVRWAALDALSLAFARGDDVGAGTLLESVLRTGDADERELAFGALCQPARVRPRFEALHAYWSERDEGERLELLRELPRGDAPVPFRDALLALGERGGAERSAVLDLLESFRNDDGVGRALTAWLGEELDLVRAGAGRDEASGAATRAAELRASGLVRALGRVLDDAACGSIRGALEASVGVSPQIGKVAAAVLGSSAAGRALLPEFLDERVDVRTRIEVAIALAESGDPRVTDVLIEELAGATFDLAGRMALALGLVRERRAFEWLAERTLDPSATVALRRVAVEALAQRPAGDAVLDALARGASDAPDVETRIAALRLLGRARDGGSRRLLELHERTVAEGWPHGIGAREYRVQLLLALASTGDLPDRLLGEVLADPLASADEWLERRFRGVEGARAEFEWDGEIAMAGALASEGRADELFAASGPWWRLDARLLLALGVRVAEQAVDAEGLLVASELLRASSVAFAGEAGREPDLELRALSARLEVGYAREEWAEVAAIADRLVGEWRERRVSDRAWNVLVGEIDRRVGVDPPGRLAALVWQARSYAALDRGERDDARELAAIASGLIGFSHAARDEQTALETRLGAR